MSRNPSKTPQHKLDFALDDAARAGDWEKLNRLRSEGANPTWLLTQLMLESTQSKNKEKVEEILNLKDPNFHLKESFLISLIEIASANDDFNIVELLLDSKRVTDKRKASIRAILYATSENMLTALMNYQLIASDSKILACLIGKSIRLELFDFALSLIKAYDNEINLIPLLHSSVKTDDSAIIMNFLLDKVLLSQADKEILLLLATESGNLNAMKTFLTVFKFSPLFMENLTLEFGLLYNNYVSHDYRTNIFATKKGKEVNFIKSNHPNENNQDADVDKSHADLKKICLSYDVISITNLLKNGKFDANFIKNLQLKLECQRENGHENEACHSNRNAIISALEKNYDINKLKEFVTTDGKIQEALLAAAANGRINDISTLLKGTHFKSDFINKLIDGLKNLNATHVRCYQHDKNDKRKDIIEQFDTVIQERATNVRHREKSNTTTTLFWKDSD